jgi:hypothetical protein
MFLYSILCMHIISYTIPCSYVLVVVKLLMFMFLYSILCMHISTLHHSLVLRMSSSQAAHVYVLVFHVVYAHQ